MKPLALSLEPLVAWPLVAAAAAVVLTTMAVAAARRRGGTRRSWLVRGSIVGVAALAMLGPHAGSEAWTYQQRPETQVLVALDATASMAVADQAGTSRWQAAVADVVQMVEAPNSSFALVTWGSRARLAVPFTTDAASLESVVNALDTERPVEGVGSRLDRPLTVLSRVLAQARSQHPDRATMLVLLSDGENTARGEQRPYSALAPLVSSGVVVGYGSEGGGAVPLDPPDQARVVRDPSTGSPAVSRREGENLQKAASELGVQYLEREDVEDLADVLSTLEPELRTVTGPSSPRNLTWVLGLLLLALVSLELRTAARSVRELRDLRRPR